MAKKTAKKPGGAKKAGPKKAAAKKAAAETTRWNNDDITKALDTALVDLRGKIKVGQAGWNHRQKMKIAMAEAALQFAIKACACTSSSMSLP